MSEAYGWKGSMFLICGKIAHLPVNQLHSSTKFLVLFHCDELLTSPEMFFYCSDACLLSLASPQVEHSTTTGRAAHSVDVRCEHAILAELTHWRIVIDDYIYLHTSKMQLKTRCFHQVEWPQRRSQGCSHLQSLMKKKKKDFTRFCQPTQPITCASYGNHVQINMKSRQSTT